MTSQQRQGPPDKPNNIFETMYVGGIIVGIALLGSVLLGTALAVLEFIFGIIGLWLIVGIPVAAIATVVVGFTWRHIDKQDPFKFRLPFKKG